jgi:hypothetical protein
MIIKSLVNHGDTETLRKKQVKNSVAQCLRSYGFGLLQEVKYLLGSDAAKSGNKS